MTRRNWLAGAGVSALAVLAVLAGALLPAGAGAAPASGELTLRLGGVAAAGLRAADVRLAVGAGGAGARVALPVSSLRRARGATVIGSDARLVFRAGRRQVAARGLRLALGRGARLEGRLGGGGRVTIARLDTSRARRSVTGGALRLTAARAILTEAAARRLRSALRRPGLVPGALGTLTVRAGLLPAVPAPAPAGPAPTPAERPETGPWPGEEARAIVGGELGWGFSNAVREMFPAYDPANEGSYNYNTGEPYRAFFDGAAQDADDTFDFALAGGSYDPAAARAEVEASGWVRMGYCVGGFSPDPEDSSGQRENACPGDAGGAHGIWVNLGEIEIEIEAGQGTLSTLSDAGYHGKPPVPRERRVAAELELTAPPTLSPDGRTVTWSGVEATLTAAGEALGLGVYKAGFGLDPLTISAQLED